MSAVRASAAPASEGTRAPGLSVRAALAALRDRAPQEIHAGDAVPLDAVAADYARRFGGIPATRHARREDVVVYPARVAGQETDPFAGLDVLLGLYGDRHRLEAWLPGLPRMVTRAAVDDLLAARAPARDHPGAAPCQQVRALRVDLGLLPALRATPRDAGPFLTLGVVLAEDVDRGPGAMSVHRLLVLDDRRLTLWMVPNRHLLRLYQRARAVGRPLPVSVNVGAPPAAVVASALSTRWLPPGVTKPGLATALAGAPLTLAPALTQPTPVLAESEIVVEGELRGDVADESRDGAPGVSLPEFTGYDGQARRALPVITVTGLTRRRDAVYQAVIGPGREQSVLLGAAGELSMMLSLDPQDARLVTDLHCSPAGGGMLLVFVSVRKATPDDDLAPHRLALALLRRHPFAKLVVVTDDDVDVRCGEDVWWAVTTRSNPGVDTRTWAEFDRLPVDPSATAQWAAARGTDGGGGRSSIDATMPFTLRAATARSFGDDLRREDR